MGRSQRGVAGAGTTGIQTMREEDLESYFKFMEHYERAFD